MKNRLLNGTNRRGITRLRMITFRARTSNVSLKQRLVGLLRKRDEGNSIDSPGENGAAEEPNSKMPPVP